ncbi:MAG: hypothetical protein JNK04_24880 [Myxococcales bacterium]|nr:hypothetical protein [Myxococcales bacterium]
MLDDTDAIWSEEALLDDVDDDPRDTIPEVKQYLAQCSRAEEDPTFRRIVEHPDACARAWWRPSRGRPLYAA